ncbi:MAG: SdiA-regulated domain-containing protein [Spirochaetota bacterium]
MKQWIVVFSLLLCISCQREDKHSLAPAEKERKFASLLPEFEKSQEASGLTYTGEKFYVVFDNHNKVAQVAKDLESAKLYPTPYQLSDFEGITSSDQGFAIVVEAKKKKRRTIPQVLLLDKAFQALAKQNIDIDLQKSNKGIEGITRVNRGEREYYFLLCEGNYCVSTKKKDRGNGRIYVLERYANELNLVAEIAIPKQAKFRDYSGIDIRGGNVAIVSQESSALWLGQLSWTSWQLKHQSLWNFPEESGETVYCNVEGVAWISEDRIAVVSDKAKKKEKQCRKKSEMIHIFQVPKGKK